jgi:hypothetical protein
VRTALAALARTRLTRFTRLALDANLATAPSTVLLLLLATLRQEILIASPVPIEPIRVVVG